MNERKVRAAAEEAINEILRLEAENEQLRAEHGEVQRLNAKIMKMAEDGILFAAQMNALIDECEERIAKLEEFVRASDDWRSYSMHDQTDRMDEARAAISWIPTAPTSSTRPED